MTRRSTTPAQRAAARANLAKARAAKKRAASLTNIRQQVRRGAPLKYRGPFAVSYPIGSKPKPATHAVVQGKYAPLRGVVGKPIKGGLGLGGRRS